MRKYIMILSAALALVTLISGCSIRLNIPGNTEPPAISELVMPKPSESAETEPSDPSDTPEPSGSTLSWKVLTEEEVREIVSGLWERFVTVRGYYSNDGLPVDAEKDLLLENGIDYYPVSGDIQSIAELKAATEKVVTAEYAEREFYGFGFGGALPLFIENDDTLYQALPGGIGFPEEWRFETLAVESQTEDTLVVSAEQYIWTTEETFVKEIRLKYEKGWRIDFIESDADAQN